MILFGILMKIIKMICMYRLINSHLSKKCPNITGSAVLQELCIT